MSITLDATLKTAQDGINHRPIVEIVSEPMAPVIPIRGNYLNTSTTDENDPNIIYTSAGRLGLVYEKSGDIHYLYTPTDLSEFIEVTIATGTYKDPCLCELANGNIGIVYFSTIGDDDMYCIVVTPTGTEVVAGAQIYNNPGTLWMANASVIKLADDSYLLVYAEGTDSPPDQGNTYCLKKFTSTDFSSWTGPTTILTGNDYYNNPHLFQLSGGRIYLHYDQLTFYQNAVEINNIFSCYSDNNGTSWSAPIQLTSITDLGTTALHPSVIENDSGSLILVYNLNQNVKIINSSLSGYPGTSMTVKHIDFNVEDQEIYITGEDLIDVNVTTLDFIKYYSGSTSPALSDVSHAWDGSGIYGLTGHNPVYVINHETETVTTLVDGVNYQSGGNTTYTQCAFLREDGGDVQIWMIRQWGGRLLNRNNLEIGYVNIESPPDPMTGMYPYTSIYSGTGTGNVALATAEYVEASDWIMTYGASSAYLWAGGLYIYNLDGTQVKIYKEGEFKYIRSAIIYGNYLYFSFVYKSDRPDTRGLGQIDLDTDNVTYFTPNWATLDDYELDNIIHMEGTTKIAMTCNQGIATFDTSDYSWYVYDEDTLPGLAQPCGSAYCVGGLCARGSFVDLKYDPTTEVFYAAHQRVKFFEFDECSYIAIFSTSGYFSVLNYFQIDDPDTTAVPGEESQLSYESFENQPVVAYTGTEMWFLWSHEEDGECSIQWANTIANKDLSDFLDINTPVAILWDIDRPTKLTFALSHGHLFDTQNLLSAYSPYLKRGRLLTVRMGENISSVEYWQNQGQFIVTEQTVKYTNDKYPTISIVAEDMRCLWEDNHVIATEYFNGENPDTILTAILNDHAYLEYDDMNIPAFSGSHSIYHQYIDMKLDDIVKSLLDHFMYFPFVNVDGEFEPRHLDISKSTDHTYSDNVQMQEYSPDGKYSTFINRIVVTGLSNVYYEVLYEEETVASLSGTTGWWGKKEDEMVWYSDNHTRTCRYPRMEVIQSVSDFELFFRIGGGNERLSSVDADEQYCVVTIDAPDLIPTLIGAIAAAVATYTACQGSCDGGPHKPGWCSYCNFAVVVELNIIILILSAIASYSYVIWARPIGHEKRSHEAEANDYDFQAELNGKAITEVIDDPYCYTIGLCQTVADNEMAVVMAQRNRHKFSKTAHLQDEIGDIVSTIHPYSTISMKTMIVNLKREMTIGKSFIDNIEGWRLD